MTAPPTVTTSSDRRDQLVDRLFSDTIGALELLSVYVGDRLGLYAALAEGPATSAELATRAGIAERYAREWLEQQAVAALVDHDGHPDGGLRRYSLDPAVTEVVLDREALSYLAPLAAGIVGAARALPAVMEAFRSGGGVPYASYGDEFRGAIAALNRPMFLDQLASTWLPALPDVDRRLRAAPPARVLDIGCGCGWSTIAIARAYPGAEVVGVDSDAASIELARANAASAGLDGRVRFVSADVGAIDGEGFDLACAFECIHDMSDPVGALSAVRQALVPGGTLLIGDEKVEEEFVAPGSLTERAAYGWSTLHCLPVGMAEQPSAGTGTVMRPATLRSYTEAAGFTRCEILDIDHDFWNFYRVGTA
jgi:SAM-dependent methyltransferase